MVSNGKCFISTGKMMIDIDNINFLVTEGNEIKLYLKHRSQLNVTRDVIGGFITKTEPQDIQCVGLKTASPVDAQKLFDTLEEGMQSSGVINIKDLVIL
jgi:hypothetical protein